MIRSLAALLILALVILSAPGCSTLGEFFDPAGYQELSQLQPESELAAEWLEWGRDYDRFGLIVSLATPIKATLPADSKVAPWADAVVRSIQQNFYASYRALDERRDPEASRRHRSLAMQSMATLKSVMGIVEPDERVALPDDLVVSPPVASPFPEEVPDAY